MVQAEGFALDPWPLSRPPGDWATLSKDEVKILKEALEDKSLSRTAQEVGIAYCEEGSCSPHGRPRRLRLRLVVGGLR